MFRRSARTRHPSPITRHAAFTLLELLVVMGIIAIVLGFLIPSLGTGSGRSAEAAARQLSADLDGARLTAIAERTRTRILFPTNNSNFTAGTSSNAWPTDVAYRGYLVVSLEKAGPSPNPWKQRGKWNRFPSGTGLPSVSPTPAPTTMPIDVSGNGSTSYTFNGPYIEFLANGSSNLDPSVSPAPNAVIADGFVDSNGTFVLKNAKLRYTITVDPLTGAVTLK